MQQYIFPSLEKSTSFKRKLNESKIYEIGFADLNAHLLDNHLVNQRVKKNTFKYLVINLLWIISKLFSKKKITLRNIDILLVPAELEKEKSIGLYKPIFQYLKKKKYKSIALKKIFESINFIIFLKWLIKIPKIIKSALKIINNDEYSEKLGEIKWLLIIDSVFQYLWILMLRNLFNNSEIKSVLVDWDRDKLQSLIVLAARLESIKTFTFVHGAMYTNEKFVPLIAENCLVWGNFHINFFIKLGEKEKKLLKVGNTRFRSSLPDRQTILNKYKIDTNKKIIVHPSQNFPDIEDHVVIKNIYEFVSKNENFQLAIKFHPSQDNTKLLSKIKTLKNIIILDKSISVHEALAIAEFTIIVSSTFAIEALISNVPVALYKPGTKLRGIAIDLAEKANVPLLQNEEDFVLFMNNIINLPIKYSFDLDSQRNFIKNYCEFYGEESGKLISNLL